MATGEGNERKEAEAEKEASAEERCRALARSLVKGRIVGCLIKEQQAQADCELVEKSTVRQRKGERKRESWLSSSNGQRT